jgi:hypothetical protein
MLTPLARRVSATLAAVAAALGIWLTVLQIQDESAPVAAGPQDLEVRAEHISTLPVVGYDGYAFDTGQALPGVTPFGQCDTEVKTQLAAVPQTNPTTSFVLTNTFAKGGSPGQLFVHDIRLDIVSSTEAGHVMEFRCPNAGEGSADYLIADLARSPAAEFVNKYLYDEGTQGAPVFVVEPGETVSFSVTSLSDLDAEVRVLATVFSGDGTHWDVDLTERLGPVSVAGSAAIEASLEPTNTLSSGGLPVYYCKDAVAGAFDGQCSFTDDLAPGADELRQLRVDQSTASDVLEIGFR